MTFNLERLPATEAEALAYSEGYPNTARLFARIDDLQRALEQALVAIGDGLMTAKQAAGAAREALAIIEGLTE